MAAAAPGPRLYRSRRPERTVLYRALGDSFERFLWSSFDRVEEKGGSLILANNDGVTFYMPVEKLQDPAIRRAIFDFVSGRVAVHG